MIVPTRVYRCEKCGSKRLGTQVIALDWHYDAAGEPIIPKSVICTDRRLCLELQTAPPTVPMAEIRAALQSEEELPF